MDDRWERRNCEYLVAGLSWLRSVLSTSGPAQRDDAWWVPFADDDPDAMPALEILAARLELSRFETTVLLLCVAMELDPDMQRRCAGVTHDPTQAAPTFAIALDRLPEPTWDALSPHRPLRHWRLINIDHSAGRPLTSTPLRADERIVNFVKGLNAIDERLNPVLRVLPEVSAAALPTSQQDTVARVISAWAEEHSDGRLPIVELLGPDRRTNRSLASAAAGRAGLTLYEIAASQPPCGVSDVSELVRLLDRESALLPIAFYLDLAEAAQPTDQFSTELLNDVHGPIMTGVAEAWPLVRRRTRLVDARRPTTLEQERIWFDVLGPGQPALAAQLADHFDLDPDTIRDCAAHAQSRPDGTGTGTGSNGELMWEACRDQNRPRLSAHATCIEPQAGWDDLVLPPDELSILHRLADQVRGRPKVLREWGLQPSDTRGRGITALFAGQSGTGKTLAAEVLAHDLGLSLYRVDLSSVVSKYIGETERNLRRVFDAADEGGGLLFFDEADALFGRRSEVKDSHDRYANIEVNYLLQRMEDFRGVAVLATNQPQALDTAFLRRLRFVITFPFPTREERYALWTKAFPATAPTNGLDLDRLAELPANGGMIRNIALNTAFCAAGQGEQITMPLLLTMARDEFRKLNLPLTDSHFRLAEVV